jgi:phosphotransferase system enzyme I (PtsI)
VHRLTGIGVSPGIVVGRAVLLWQNPLVIRFPIAADRVPAEVARLEEARGRSRQQLLEIRSRVACGAAAELGYLFEAQLLMLDDQMLTTRASEVIRSQQVNAEWAVQRAFDDVARIFDGIEDAYLAERKGDVADVVGRLRMNLERARGRGRDLFRDIGAASVLIADELTPSMAAQVDWDKVLGFATDVGSRTHHTAILARSLRVPAVVGLGQASSRIAPGALVIIDGTTGEVEVDPPDARVEEARQQSAQWLGQVRGHVALSSARVLTSDGTAVSLHANIELPDDISVARRYGAESIGLFRSEFLLAMHGAGPPNEDAQFAAYRTLVEGMAPGSVTVRTFDVDEEQLQPWTRGATDGPGGAQALHSSRGPMGLRAIRLSLAHREFFKVQLRALVRAARYGRLRLIFPFVSGLEELREARRVLAEAAEELRARGETLDRLPQVGVMIEIPSAAVTADLLAREADFFSIGTNDLIQYSLAVDRTDASVSRLYEPLHPAVLRTIRLVVRAARRRALPVSLCGEMASDPVILPLLIGMGLTEFSMSPAALPTAREVVKDLDVGAARRLAARIMRLATVAEIEQVLTRAHGAFPARGASPAPAAGTGGTSGEQ